MNLLEDMIVFMINAFDTDLAKENIILKLNFAIFE